MSGRKPRFLRWTYFLLSYLLAPFVLGFLVWRGIGNRAYWERFGERFGYAGVDGKKRSIWIHAVSVGEVQAAAPLIRALCDRHAQIPVIVTTITPTGAQRVQHLFGKRVQHVYAPYDLPGGVRRFFDRIRPRLAVIIETELWPNLFNECGSRGVPLVLASARISPRSLGKYRRFTALFREALSHGIVIAAQSDADAERFRTIGANPERTHVTGNIKFDMRIPVEQRQAGDAFRAQLGPDRPVWIAGSTHDSEEVSVLAAHETIRAQHEDALLILVPRHPERFAAVIDLVRDRGLRFATRSGAEPCTAETEVFVVDTLGELPLFYAAADVAFVAGSFAPIGGHNMLEPAAMAVPVLTGTHNFNAQEICDLLIAAGAALIVRNPEELASTVIELLRDPARRARMGQSGARAVEENRGAVARLLALIEPLVEESPPISSPDVPPAPG